MTTGYFRNQGEKKFLVTMRPNIIKWLKVWLLWWNTDGTYWSPSGGRGWDATWWPQRPLGGKDRGDMGRQSVFPQQPARTRQPCSTCAQHGFYCTDQCAKKQYLVFFKSKLNLTLCSCPVLPPLGWWQIHFVIILGPLLDWASLVAQLVKNPPAMQETPVRFLGQEDPLEKG